MKKLIMINFCILCSLVCCFSFPRKPPKKYYNKAEVIENEISYRIIIKSLKKITDYELVELHFLNTRLVSDYLAQNDIFLKTEGKISYFEINKKLLQDNNTDIYDVVFYLYNKRKGRCECYNILNS